MTQVATPGVAVSDAPTQERVHHWIGGRTVVGTSGRDGPVYDPATGQVTRHVDFASVAEVSAVVAEATAAFPRWRATSLSKRTDIMFKIRNLVESHRHELAGHLTAEHGKVPSDALGEIARGLENLEFACSIPTLLKGVFTEVHGDKVAVDAILEHPDVAAVSFVGSTPIARYIYEAGTKAGKRVQALGGAKNHMIVLPDADIEMAADAAISAGYGSAGERCMAIATVVAVGSVADPLVDAIKARLPRVKVGP